MKRNAPPDGPAGRGNGNRENVDTPDSTRRAATRQAYFLDLIDSPPETAEIAEARRRMNQAKRVFDRLRWEQRCSAFDGARRAFAALNGWHCARSAFTLGALARNMPHGGGDQWSTDFGFSGQAPGPWRHYYTLDHAEYYRVPVKPYRAAAIVAHLYGPLDKQDPLAMAATYGLTVHRPPSPFASWHAPGGTALVVYTRPGVVVRWLPEQSDPRWTVRP